MKPEKALPLQVWVALGVMAMKEYFPFLKASELEY